MPCQEEANQLLGEVPTRDQPRLLCQVSRAGSLRLAAGASLVFAALAATYCAAHLRAPAASSSMRGAAIANPVGLVATPDDEPCHTAVEGERCYETIVWHQTNSGGALKHPEWKTGLDEDSTAEEIQTWLHKDQRTCPRPCPRVVKKPEHESKTPEDKQSNKTSGNKTRESGDCHTAVKGEKCFEAVRAAMADEISAHPDRYPGLDASSPFSEFQAALHWMGRADCPRPCSDNATARADVNASANASANVTDGPRGVEPVGGNAVPVKRNKSEEEALACHTATEGERCYQGVVDAMLHDVYENSQKYGGLTGASTFEEFQAYSHREQRHECPLPCHACHTAVPGEKCYKLVMEVMNGSDGDDEETFESIQERLHLKGCPKPCAPRPVGTPSLYCFAVVRAESYEATIVETQLQMHVGIVACDGFAVLSSTPMVLGHGRERVEAITFEPAAVGTSRDGTAGNTQLFMNAWAALLREGSFRRYDWTIKVDPDAILLPSRLRKHLVSYNGWNTYLNNCNHFGGSDLFGAIEVFSRSAIEQYYNDINGPNRCRNELYWQEWGEDVFISKCLGLLGTQASEDFQLVSDDRCNGVNCYDPWPAAFHPFKTNASWTACLRQAMGV